MTSQYCTVMTCEWLWLATTLLVTPSDSFPEATRMLTRLVCAIRSDALLIACWKF